MISGRIGESVGCACTSLLCSYISYTKHEEYSARLKTDRKATVVSFPANPGLGDAGSNWLKMDRHLLEDHPTGYESLLNMTETEIISMKQNMKIKTGGL